MKSKYNNVKKEFDGLKFASKKELKHYHLLKLLESQGHIHDLKCQVRFNFLINEKIVRFPGSNRPLTYVADFEYFTSDGERKVVDVKGFKTDVYKIKQALMLACWDIVIEEV